MQTARGRERTPCARGQIDDWATLWAMRACIVLVAASAHALVTCPCDRFSDTQAIFTLCNTGTGASPVGSWVAFYPGTSGWPAANDWTTAADRVAIDLCGAAQNNTHQPELLYGFNIILPGWYRIETSALSSVDDDYTVVLQLETGHPDGYYVNDEHFDTSKRKCNIGQTKSGNSYQAQVTEYLFARYYVVIIESTPGSVNRPNVYFKLTRVDQTGSPSRSPTPPTTRRAPTAAVTQAAPTTTLTPTLASDALASTTTSASPALAGSLLGMLMGLCACMAL